MENLIPVTNEVTMTSVEVVELINQFRAIEGKSALQHYHFMRDIRKELDTLELLGLGVQSKFGLYSYTAENGKTNPCFKMNRDAILLMLNKESTLVRAKTIEYINALENKIQRQELMETTQLQHAQIQVQQSQLQLQQSQIQAQQTQLEELQKLIGLRSKRTFDYVKYIKDCLGVKKVNEEYKRVKQRLFHEFNVTKFEELTYSDEVLERIEEIAKQIKQPKLYREGTLIAKVFNDFIENLNK